MDYLLNFVNKEPLMTAVIGIAALKHLSMSGLARGKPSGLEQVGVVSEITLYPIKSCGGVKVNQAACLSLGLKVQEFRDRHWMIVNSKREFMTQKFEPKLALVSVALGEDSLLVSAAGMKDLKVPLKVNEQNVITCTAFNDPIPAVACGPEAATWFDNFLGSQGHQLVYALPSLPKREMGKCKRRFHQMFQPEDSVAFSDIAAMHIVSRASLENVKSQTKDGEITMENFRPNIVVDKCAAFDEDTWDVVFINDVKFRFVKLTQRCALVTTDQKTGGRLPKSEPLTSMRKFRCVQRHYYKDSPCLGVHLSVDATGIVNVGDPIYALRQKPNV